MIIHSISQYGGLILCLPISVAKDIIFAWLLVKT